MEVHGRIVANLGFKFRSQFTPHCGRGACGRERRDHRREEWGRSSRAMLAPTRPSCYISGIGMRSHHFKFRLLLSLLVKGCCPAVGKVGSKRKREKERSMKLILRAKYLYKHRSQRPSENSPNSTHRTVAYRSTIVYRSNDSETINTSRWIAMQAKH